MKTFLPSSGNLSTQCSVRVELTEVTWQVLQFLQKKGTGPEIIVWHDCTTQSCWQRKRSKQIRLLTDCMSLSPESQGRPLEISGTRRETKQWMLCSYSVNGRLSCLMKTSEPPHIISQSFLTNKPRLWTEAEEMIQAGNECLNGFSYLFV